MEAMRYPFVKCLFAKCSPDDYFDSYIRNDYYNSYVTANSKTDTALLAKYGKLSGSRIKTPNNE